MDHVKLFVALLCAFMVLSFNSTEAARHRKPTVTKTRKSVLADDPKQQNAKSINEDYDVGNYDEYDEKMDKKSG